MVLEMSCEALTTLSRSNMSESFCGESVVLITVDSSCLMVFANLSNVHVDIYREYCVTYVIYLDICLSLT